MMRLSLISVGKLKDSGERELCKRYLDRISGVAGSLGFSKLACRELAESRAQTALLRITQEGQEIVSQLTDIEVKIALDEKGDAMTSRALALWMAGRRDDGVRSMTFVIGGPDGLDEGVRKAATKVLSLSAMTLPHGLARILLVEQIYRAMTILNNHPYHRA